MPNIQILCVLDTMSETVRFLRVDVSNYWRLDEAGLLEDAKRKIVDSVTDGGATSWDAQYMRVEKDNIINHEWTLIL